MRTDLKEIQMSDGNDVTNRRYTVLINGEDQYSIWPEGKVPPDGWKQAGFAGRKDECIAHVDHVWQDLRPRSLRIAMESR